MDFAVSEKVPIERGIQERKIRRKKFLRAQNSSQFGNKKCGYGGLYNQRLSLIEIVFSSHRCFLFRLYFPLAFARKDSLYTNYYGTCTYVQNVYDFNLEKKVKLFSGNEELIILFVFYKNFKTPWMCSSFRFTLFPCCFSHFRVSYSVADEWQQ